MRKQLFLIIALFLTNNSFCQEFDWAVSGGGWVNDMATGLTTDKSNNIFLTGSVGTSSTIYDTVTINQGAYLIKFTNSGNIDWYVNFGTSYTHGVDIAVDEAGNTYLTGIYSHGFTFDGITFQGGNQFRIFLMKFDKLGNLLWAKQYGANSNSRSCINAIALDDANNIYIAGNFENQIDIEDSIYTVRGQYGNAFDMLLIKVSSNGDVIYAKTAGSASDEYIYDIAVNQDGIYAVGYWGGKNIEIDTTQYESYQNELGYIMKYNHNGDFEWANTINAPYYSVAYSITLNENSEAIVASLWYEGNGLNQDRLSVTKFDNAGNQLNNQLINGSTYLSGYTAGIFGRKRWDVSSNDQCTYLTAGLSDSFDLENLSFNSIGSQDIVIVKFNEVGFPQWLTVVKGTGDDEGIRLASNNDTLYIAGVYSSSELNFDTLSIQNNSGNNNDDFFLAKLIDTTSIICPEIDSFYLDYPTIICKGDSVLISIENNYATYTEWYHNEDLLNFKNEKHIYIKEEGIYKVKINNGTRCPVPEIQLRVDSQENQDENTDIIIYSKPAAEIEGVEQICFGDTLKLITLSDTDYIYNWTLPNSFNNIDTTNNILEVEMSENIDSAKFYLKVTNEQNGCFNTDSLSVYINPTPDITLYRNGNSISTYSYNTDYLQWFYEGIELLDFVNYQTIVVDTTGYYYVIGSNNYGCTSTSDSIFISEILSVENVEIDFYLNVYPNPASDHIIVDMNMQIEKIELINTSGTIVKEFNNKSYLDLKNIDKGIYILNIYSNNFVKTVKIIKN